MDWPWGAWLTMPALHRGFCLVQCHTQLTGPWVTLRKLLQDGRQSLIQASLSFVKLDSSAVLWHSTSVGCEMPR